MTTVAVVVFEGVEDIDLMIPVSVLNKANDAPETHTGFSIRFVSPARSTAVSTAAGFICPAAVFDPAVVAASDVLMFPGGRRARDCDLDESFRLAVQERVAARRPCFSVCSGAFLLARCGVLTGRRVAVHAAKSTALADLGNCTVGTGLIADWPIVSVGGSLPQGNLKSVVAAFALIEMYAPAARNHVRERLELSEIFGFSEGELDEFEGHSRTAF